MKKSILKNLVILSFAFGGLFLVGNNVFADPAVTMPPDDQGGGGGYSCSSEAYCFIDGNRAGSVSCTGSICYMGYQWVECDDNLTMCWETP